MNQLSRTVLAIDVYDGQTFSGFTTGENWNGWACPYFTYEQAESIMNAHRARGWKALYDAGHDSFIFDFSHQGNEEADEFPAVAIEGRKLYPIGTNCWIWEEVTEEVV